MKTLNSLNIVELTEHSDMVFNQKAMTTIEFIEELFKYSESQKLAMKFEWFTNERQELVLSVEE